MSDELQYKSFTTRKMRADVHYRLRLLALRVGKTQEYIFNEAVSEGLDIIEARAKEKEMAMEGRMQESRGVMDVFAVKVGDLEDSI